MMRHATGMLMVVAVIGLSATMQGGCASGSGPSTFGVAHGEYDRAFIATRETLRDANFEIERVDATRGVITTKSRPDSGFFTPWTGYQLDAASAVEGSLNQQRRRVRVVFIPTADEAAYRSGGGDQDRIGSQLDEVASRGPWTAYVDVGVTRVQTSGLRPPSRSVLMSTVSTDPIAQAQGVSTIYEVPVSQDPAMAAALTRKIRTRLGQVDDAPTPKANSTNGDSTKATTHRASTHQASAPAPAPEPVAPDVVPPAPTTPSQPLPQPASQADPALELIPVPPRR